MGEKIRCVKTFVFILQFNKSPSLALWHQHCVRHCFLAALWLTCWLISVIKVGRIHVCQWFIEWVSPITGVSLNYVSDTPCLSRRRQTHSPPASTCCLQSIDWWPISLCRFSCFISRKKPSALTAGDKFCIKASQWVLNLPYICFEAVKIHPLLCFLLLGPHVRLENS